MYGDPRDPVVTSLLLESHALMERLFPAESNNFLSVDALCEPNIRFFVGLIKGQTKGVGALSLKTNYGELKSMFVSEDARGSGLADVILDRIKTEARANGLAKLMLETGTLLYAAHAFYRRNGYQQCGHFGDYLDTPYSLYMEKVL